jgi:hypothetical protein
MTTRSDFKTIVRARMARTGENYTTARAALELDRGAAWAAHLRLLRPHVEDGRVDTDIRLLRIPARRRARFAVLLQLLPRFVPGETYTETQVNALLRPAHDVAYLRRELVDYRLLERDSLGSYWVAPTPPVRAANEAQESGDWERIWLPEFLAAGERGRVRL